MNPRHLNIGQKYTIPEDWPYERARELFKEPDVADPKGIEVILYLFIDLFKGYFVNVVLSDLGH